jgi:hypothetical protein
MYETKFLCRSFNSGGELAEWVQSIADSHTHWEIVIQYSTAGGTEMSYDPFFTIIFSAFLYLRRKKDVDTLLHASYTGPDKACIEVYKQIEIIT